MNNSETLHGDKIYYGELQVRAMPGVHEAAFAALKEFVEPNRKILEIGSGMGALTRRINEGGYDIVASGIDPDDYRYADVSFMRLDLSKPIDSQLRGAYGALVATEVIEHVENVFLFFRNAHDLVGKLAAESSNSGVPLDQLPIKLLKELCPELLPDWQKLFDPLRSLAARTAPGAPSLENVRTRLSHWRDILG